MSYSGSQTYGQPVSALAKARPGATGGVGAGPAVGPNTGVPGRGLVRVVSPGELQDKDRADESARNAAKGANEEAQLDGLMAHIRNQFEMMRRHRDSANGWTTRMMDAARAFNGEYHPAKVAQIKQFGGSDIYARIIAVKCRGATALLRDIYLGATKPWGIKPSPQPTLPEDVSKAVDDLIKTEAESNAASGIPTTPDQIAQRRSQLQVVVEQGMQKKANDEATRAMRHMDDRLVEGGFYHALAEFMVDLPLFPFACIKGPIVRMTTALKWEKLAPEPEAASPMTPDPMNPMGASMGGQVTPPQGPRFRAVEKQIPKMYWERISPFDLWWTPGGGRVQSCDFIERSRLSRAEINELIGVPGWDEEAIRAALAEYPHGHAESQDTADSTRAEMERREDPSFNESGMYDMLEYNGSVTGQCLLDKGWTEKQVPDALRSYSIQAWSIGRFVLKVQFSPSPRKRPPYYVTSFEKVPGTLVGNSVPDILSDIQDVCNATLRSLVNNVAIASGPQVVVNDEVLSEYEEGVRLVPWKIWHYSQEMGQSTTREPVTFFQPKSNAQELLGIYEKFTQMADELSAIPRYITGSDRMGGAGRTASGLAMLMNNASKILQTVAGNIDKDVFDPLLQALYDLIMLTDTTGVLRGDEEIEVKGVTVAMQRETERQRQMELLQITANPLDSQILGLRGRATLLRAVSDGVGLNGQSIVPPDEEMQAREKAQAAQLLAQAQLQGAQQGAPGEPGADPAAQAQGAQQGGEETGMGGPQGPRTNLLQDRPAA